MSKKRKWGIVGPSHKRNGEPRTETAFGQAIRHLPIPNVISKPLAKVTDAVLSSPLTAVAAPIGLGLGAASLLGASPLWGASALGASPLWGAIKGPLLSGASSLLLGAIKGPPKGESSASNLPRGGRRAYSSTRMHRGESWVPNMPGMKDNSLAPYAPASVKQKASPLDTLSAFSPKGLSKNPKSSYDEEYDEQNNKRKSTKKAKEFAKGGIVNPDSVGYIRQTDSGGQADDIDMDIPDKAYVMNATDVSLLGDGSSLNGAKKLMSFESNFARSGIAKPYDDNAKRIKARVSNDEYVLSPSTVSAIGGGNNEVGAKRIDKMRQNLRKHKGVSKILPPKTKDIHSYMRGGR